MLQGCVRLSVVCDVYIVAEWCVLEQKLYWQPIGSHMWGIDCYRKNKWLWPSFRGRLRSCQPSRHIRHWIYRKPLEIGLEAWFQRTINRIWPAVTVDSRRCDLLKCLLPAAPATAGCLVIVWRCEYGPGIRLLSPALLQLFGISKGLMSRLHSVQNAAACLVTGTRRSDHITPVLLQLHCRLLVCQSVDLKVATLVHQALSGISPLCL